LAGDPLAALIEQIAWNGLFDFSKVDPRNPASGHRMLHAISEQIRRNRLELAKHDYAKWVGLLSGAIGSETVKPPYDQCDYYRGKIANSLVPGWGRKQTRVEKIQEGRRLWEQTEGKLDDPKTQARIAATVKWLNENTRSR
jgi:hypothetical protein